MAFDFLLYIFRNRQSLKLIKFLRADLFMSQGVQNFANISSRFPDLFLASCRCKIIFMLVSTFHSVEHTSFLCMLPLRIFQVQTYYFGRSVCYFSMECLLLIHQGRLLLILQALFTEIICFLVRVSDIIILLIFNNMDHS